jgi:hypothetical protein
MSALSVPLSQYLRRVAGDDAPYRYGPCHHGACPDDCAGANVVHDHGMGADPAVIGKANVLSLARLERHRNVAPRRTVLP